MSVFAVKRAIVVIRWRASLSITYDVSCFTWNECLAYRQAVGNGLLVFSMPSGSVWRISTMLRGNTAVLQLYLNITNMVILLLNA